MKNEKAIDAYVVLLKREEKEGTTKWIANAKRQAAQKLKKYGIPLSKVQEILEEKGLQHLSSKLV